MHDTRHRLSFSLNYNKIVINDNLQSGVVLFENGTFSCFSIDKKIVIQELQNIITALNKARKQTMIKLTNKPVSRDSLVINTIGYFQWQLSYMGKGAYLTNDLFKVEMGFDANRITSYMSKALAEVIRSDQILTPRVDIVRRIPDAGLLVWVYKGHSIVCYERNVDGSTMHGCLVDGEYYPLAIVSVSEEAGECVLFTHELKEIITYPLDASITHFYKADERMFDEEETTDGANDSKLG